MPINEEFRGAIAKAFEDAMATVDEILHLYCLKAGAPERFSIEVFDAGGAGGGDVEHIEALVIATHPITTADWGERDFTLTARRKTRAALRTGRDSGDLVRNAKELFQDGDAPFPGACLTEINDNRICVATSGLRGTEDEAFALLVIELMKRLVPTP